LLRVDALRRSYGGRLVVDVAELELRRGEVLAVLGPNGAGKSTLLRLLLLLERADAGRIFFDGREVRAGDGAARRRMAAVFQRPFLFTGTVAYNVAFGLRARGAPASEREQRVERALAAVGLAELAGARVGTLSGGEAQRTALARALVTAPELLALDEPTANLDVTVRRRFREDLERLVRSEGRSVLVVSHDPADAFSLADRIAVMEAGRIVQQATPAELVLAPATPFVAAFSGAELLLDGRATELDPPLVRVEVTPTVALWATAGAAAGVAAGQRVHVAYRPEDVTLARADALAETSAVNRLPLVVASLAPSGSLVRVRLQGSVELVALVTARSVDALGLAPGTVVVAQLKASAVHAYRAD
jgi:molybdopterin-binding protein